MALDPHAGAPGAWRVRLFCTKGQVALAEAVLEDLAHAVATGEVAEDSPDWHVDGWFDGPPDTRLLEARLHLAREADPGGAAIRLTVDEFPAVDWLAETYAAFAPIDVGRFRIQGSHIDGPPPVGRLPLIIDAATAFGTGEHPTTAGCLMALADLAKRRRIDRRVGVLDMGAGSGILSFAAARLWGAPVLACDIDRESVRVGRINARVNRLAPLVRVTMSDGYRHPDIRGRRFPLIVANILAGPLVSMAGDLNRSLAPDGRAILSGLLTRQARWVLNAHRRYGLVPEARYEIGAWTTLVLKRAGR